MDKITISESLKTRFQKLAGLRNNSSINLNEGIKLIASFGRSDKDTLSWYGEEYLLNLTTQIINTLDEAIKKEQGLELLMSRSSTRMAENTFVTKIAVVEFGTQEKSKENEFIISLNIDYENNSNTVGTVTFKGITSSFNLSSKHSKTDLELFKQEIINNILNLVKLQEKTEKNKY